MNACTRFSSFSWFMGHPTLDPDHNNLESVQVTFRPTIGRELHNLAGTTAEGLKAIPDYACLSPKPIDLYDMLSATHRAPPHGRCGNINSLSSDGVDAIAHIGGHPSKSALSVCYWIFHLLTEFLPQPCARPWTATTSARNLKGRIKEAPYRSPDATLVRLVPARAIPA